MRSQPGTPPSAPLTSVSHAQPRLQGRVLILTSGLGFGHVRAAQAIEAAFLQRQVAVRVVDLWSLINSGAVSIIHQTYLQLVQEYPTLYERLYQLDERTWRQILESESGPPPDVMEVLELISQIASNSVAESGGAQYPTDRLLLSMLYTSLPYDRTSLGGNGIRARLALIKWSWLRMRKRLITMASGFAPDLIISTQMIPAAMIASLRDRQMSMPHIGVPTDYGVHDFWRQPGIDRYCIAHESVIPDDASDHSRLVTTGVPLMAAFSQPLSQREARAQLRLHPDRKMVLILGGGLGLSVDAIAGRLLEGAAEATLVVMPGRNAVARSALTRQLSAAPGRLQICSWTDRMDIYMRAADVVVGKPGGVSVAEVLACGRPLFATRSLGGQEGFNVRFLEQHGVGALVRDEDLAARIERAISDPRGLADMQQRAWELGKRDGAASVAELGLDLMASQRRTARGLQ
ncbi:MGDG synthase family glycosyltransferase [Povalibacter sp.]|uniref:MGDG synthase family glycosyltransferase n=1 Tax=Povalibacter sp. TaxID=1962978 RepID=UPI002F41CF99